MAGYKGTLPNSFKEFVSLGDSIKCTSCRGEGRLPVPSATDPVSMNDTEARLWFVSTVGIFGAVRATQMLHALQAAKIIKEVSYS